MIEYLDWYLIDFERLLAADARAQRTLDDWLECAEPLKACFGQMSPANVQPHLMARYLTLG